MTPTLLLAALSAGAAQPPAAAGAGDFGVLVYGSTPSGVLAAVAGSTGLDGGGEARRAAEGGGGGTGPLPLRSAHEELVQAACEALGLRRSRSSVRS